MSPWMKNVLKAGATLFVVGGLLALAAPPLASMLGAGLIGNAALATATTTPVLWTAAFFGAFGAIDAAVRPTIARLFSDQSDEAPKAARKVRLVIALPPAQPELQTGSHAHFQELLMAQRNETLIKQQSIG